MSDTDKEFLDRHGEIGLMTYLEKWERSQGIKYETPVPFEERWRAFLESSVAATLAA